MRRWASMSELAKAGSKSLTSALQASVLRGVDQETRRMAADAVKWFEDRPTAEGISFEITAIKLAAKFHQMQVQADEVVAACLDLDTRITFRPLLPDYIEAIERIRTARRQAEVARMTVEVIDPNGVAFMVTPESAGQWIDRGWTQREVKSSDIPMEELRSKMRQVIGKLVDKSAEPSSKGDETHAS